MRAGLLFGPERAGLDNDDMAQADALVRYPLNPAFMSLNLAQAVMVMAYEWWTGRRGHAAARADDQRDARRHQGASWRISWPIWSISSMHAGSCATRRNAPGMVRNLRHFFQRGEVTEQELRTLHGVVTELALGRRQRGRLEKDMDDAI